jgi:hypothetical protein
VPIGQRKRKPSVLGPLADKDLAITIGIHGSFVCLEPRRNCRRALNELQRVTFLLERRSFCFSCLVLPFASVQYGGNVVEMRGPTGGPWTS